MSASQIFGSAYPYSYPIYNPISTPQVPPIQNNIRTVIPGRPVNNPKDIVIGDIPLDGGTAVFPKEDGRAIYVKSRNDMGGVDTKIYIPAPEDYEEPTAIEEPNISNADIMNSISEMSTQIHERMDNLEKKFNNPNKNNNRNQNGSNFKNNKQNQGGEVNA